MAYMFSKRISYSDIDEGRVYVLAGHVDTFGVEHGTLVAVRYYDQNNTWNMKFIRRPKSKYYLSCGWTDFCRYNGLIEGNIISFYDLGTLEATGQRLFKIERGLGYDLNLPPPPQV